MVYFGTSGSSYDDWVGNFHPLGVPKWERLTYCMAQFLRNLRFNHRNRDYVFSNNHWGGQAVGIIRQLRVMPD